MEIGSDLYRFISIVYKVRIEIMLKDLIGAEKSLNQAEEYYSKQPLIPPIVENFYIGVRFLYDTQLLEESILSNNKNTISKHRKNACKSCKKVLKKSSRFAPVRTESFRLVGLYYWFIDKQKKAVKYWKKAIEEGERLGARPDLARTYMEISKRFLEEKSNYKELNGIKAEEYLDKARVMFEEMDLQWDLDELDRILAYR